MRQLYVLGGYIRGRRPLHRGARRVYHQAVRQDGSSEETVREHICINLRNEENKNV